MLWNQTERVGQRGMEISANRQKAFITPQDFNLAISLASPNPGSARNPHVLKYAPVAVRWRYPV